MSVCVSVPVCVWDVGLMSSRYTGVLGWGIDNATMRSLTSLVQHHFDGGTGSLYEERESGKRVGLARWAFVNKSCLPR